jgi:hypothetical protein
MGVYTKVFWRVVGLREWRGKRVEREERGEGI